jgi:hypothetical protein
MESVLKENGAARGNLLLQQGQSMSSERPTLRDLQRAFNGSAEESRAWARRVLRKAAGCKTPERRRAYLAACLNDQKMRRRQEELERWLEDRDEAFAMMTDEERRRPEPEYDRKRAAVNKELSEIEVYLFEPRQLLTKKVGSERAGVLFAQLCAIAKADGSLVSLLRGVARAKYPDAYVAAVRKNAPRVARGRT